jgi:hypothetical protein
MIIFPLVATLVSTVFALLLFRAYGARRGLAQLAWGVAMAQFAIASLAVTIAVANGWSPTVYRVFWLFGALLNVSWLAVGSVALVSKKVIGFVALIVVAAASGFAAVSVIVADLHRAALITDSIPLGREVWGKGSLQTSLLTYYSIIPFFIVVGIAVRTTISRAGVRPPRDRMRGNILIALGTTVVAIGGFALRRVAQGAAFSVSLALGVTIMFVGFLLASRRPAEAVAEPDANLDSME